jgi:ParB-like nuclease domain
LGNAWWTVLKRETFRIAQIYVPIKRRGTIDADLVREIAESILEIGQQTPILVRPDGDRYVLVEGLHRLEACKALGEETIVGFLVSAHSSPETRMSSFQTGLEPVREKAERLRQLRLAKEAAERPSASTPKEVENRSASDTRREKGRAPRRSKTISLQDWLSEREYDGSSY